MIYHSHKEFAENITRSDSNLIALDMGAKKVGVAIFYSDLSMPMPLATIYYKDFKNLSFQLLDIINNKNIKGIVLGFPLHLDGTKGTQAEFVGKYADILSDAIRLPILLFDERMTTALANSMLKSSGLKRKKRNQKDDELAAMIILQDFLRAAKFLY